MAALPLLPAGASILGTRVILNGRDIGDLSEFDSGDYLDAATYGSNWTSAGDIRRQNAANAREVGVQAGIGALGTAAQLGIGAIPTATDARNAARIAALTDAESKGRLGLSADERQQAEATILNPARALARESEARTSQRLAGMGGASLASQVGMQAANAKAQQDAAVRAGIAINQANIDAKRQQTAELESRLKDKAEREGQNLDRLEGGLVDLARMGGKIAAAQVATRGPSDRDLLGMQSEKLADGSAAFPALQGKSVPEMREAQDAEAARRREQGRMDRMNLFEPKKKRQKPLPVDMEAAGDDLLDAATGSPYAAGG